LESNWRWNVWDLGLVYTDVTLAARLVGVLPTTYLTNERLGGGHNYVQQTVGPGTYWSVAGTLADAAGFTHFPYGHAVDPD